MRIAILTLNYYPEPDQRMHVLARGLVSRGHEVVALTAFPSYPIGRIYPGYKQRLWTRERIDGVNVIRMPVIPDHSKSAIRRALSYFSFALSASILGVFLCGRQDVMIVYHPPATLVVPAWLLRTIRRIPYVYEVQDMWPDLLESTGMVRNRVVLDAVGWLTKVGYSYSSLVNVVTPGYKRRLLSRGVPSDKIHVMLNWAYEGDFEVPPYDRELATELGFNGKFNVVYAGNMGPAQGLQNLLQAAKLIGAETGIQIVLIGDGVDRGNLEAAAQALKLTNVKFLPPMPLSEMPRVYSISQALLIHLTDDPIYSITIPGKTQSYLASGRPIIIAVDGDAADIIKEARAGLPVKPMNPEDLARAIVEMANKTEVEREAMGSAGRRYHQERLSPDVQIAAYEELLEEIANA